VGKFSCYCRVVLQKHVVFACEVNNKIIDEVASDFEVKLKAADERVNSLESEINKLKQTLAIVYGTYMRLKFRV
jgi:hypothetical protein